MRRALFAALALLAILFVAAPPPVIADTVKSGSEPILTVTITGDHEGTLFAITFSRDDTESAMATWTSFQRGLITATAIPSLTVPTGTATVRDLATPGALSGQPWRLADCTGTGTAHDGTDTRKPTAGTALIAGTGGLGQPLRR